MIVYVNNVEMVKKYVVILLEVVIKLVFVFWLGLLILIFNVFSDIFFKIVIGGLEIVVFCMLDN